MPPFTLKRGRIQLADRRAPAEGHVHGCNAYIRENQCVHAVRLVNMGPGTQRTQEGREDLRGKGDTGRKTGGERGDGTRDGRAKRRDGRVKRRDGRAKRRERAKHQKNEAQTKKNRRKPAKVDAVIWRDRWRDLAWNAVICISPPQISTNQPRTQTQVDSKAGSKTRWPSWP